MLILPGHKDEWLSMQLSFISLNPHYGFWCMIILVQILSSSSPWLLQTWGRRLCWILRRARVNILHSMKTTQRTLERRGIIMTVIYSMSKCIFLSGGPHNTGTDFSQCSWGGKSAQNGWIASLCPFPPSHIHMIHTVSQWRQPNSKQHPFRWTMTDSYLMTQKLFIWAMHIEFSQTLNDFFSHK